MIVKEVADTPASYAQESGATETCDEPEDEERRCNTVTSHQPQQACAGAESHVPILGGNAVGQVNAKNKT